MIRTGTVGSQIVDERAATYGDPVDMYTRSAQVVSGILGTEVQPWQVPLIMAGLKMVRTAITPDYSDNSDDVEGYIDIFRTLIGEDMVHASSAAEYQAKRQGLTLESIDTGYDGPPRSEAICYWCAEGESFHDPITRRCQHSRYQTTTCTAGEQS
jgi:hypothetical protein